MKDKIIAREWLREIANEMQFDTLITIAPVRYIEILNISLLQIFVALRRRYLPDLYNMRNAYANALYNKAFGKRRRAQKRLPEQNFPVIAVPEYNTSCRIDTQLHYHILAKFPREVAGGLRSFTLNFWHHMGIKHYNTAITPDLRYVSDPVKTMAYVAKNIEDDVTFEKMVVRGVRL